MSVSVRAQQQQRSNMTRMIPSQVSTDLQSPSEVSPVSSQSQPSPKSPYAGSTDCAACGLADRSCNSESPTSRRLSASPNPDGSLALYTPHKHSLHSKVLNAEVRVLDLKSGHSHTFSNDPRDREPSWLGEGNQVIWFRDVDRGSTELWISDCAGSDIEYVNQYS